MGSLGRSTRAVFTVYCSKHTMLKSYVPLSQVKEHLSDKYRSAYQELAAKYRTSVQEKTTTAQSPSSTEKATPPDLTRLKDDMRKELEKMLDKRLSSSNSASMTEKDSWKRK